VSASLPVFNITLTIRDRLFGIFISKLSELPFLRRRQGSITGPTTHFTEDDDLSLALYYIRSLSSVLRWSPEAAWAVLAKRFVRSETFQPPLSEISTFPLTHACVVPSEF
jgi:hypothetical protein